MSAQHNHRGRVLLVAVVALALLPAVATGQGSATPPAPATPATEPAVTPAAPVTEDPNACTEGRLRIQDLANADQHLSDGLARIDQRAKNWQQDAQLVELRLSCPLLKTGLQWEGTYFSETAQANFSTDTATVEPAEEAPSDIPFLDVSNVSFQVAHRSLLRAGFSDELKLAAASSVTIRRSTNESEFGPPTAPRGAVYIHVAVEERGVIKDVWVNAQDGTIYRYDLEG